MVRTKKPLPCRYSLPEASRTDDAQETAECSFEAHWTPDMRLRNVERRVLFPALNAVWKHQLLLRASNPASLALDTSLQSLRHHTLARVASWAHVTFQEDLAPVAQQCVPLHPTCADWLAQRGKEDDDVLLAQAFVPKHHLSRIVTAIARQDQVGVDTLLAVDGLGDGRGGKPTYDLRRYVERLRFGFDEDEESGGWSARDGDERVHVQAVRELYRRMAEEDEVAAEDRKRVVYLAVRNALASPTQEEEEGSGAIAQRWSALYVEQIGGGEQRRRRLAAKFLSVQHKTTQRKKRKMAESDEEVEAEEET